MAACTYSTPSPPAPPIPPPSPPQHPAPPSPPPPPLASSGTLRAAATELASDPDCLPVSYSACLEAAQQLHASNPAVSPNIQLSQAACEGLEVETASCFVGCALGNELGVPALYTFRRASVAAEFAEFNSHRCEANMEHPLCLCATPPPPPPPVYDAHSILLKDYAFAGTPLVSSASAQPSGYWKPVAVDSRLPDEAATGTHVVDCRGSDSGAATCTRACAEDLQGLLRGFAVKAHALPPSPPPPTPPPAPPAPPPSPSPPLSTHRFNGATDGCAKQGIYTNNLECRDGGVGSVYPPLCSYGSQARLRLVLSFDYTLVFPPTDPITRFDDHPSLTVHVFLLWVFVA